MTPHTLTDLEGALRASWAADTCSPDDVARAAWSGDNPAWGHCDITALVVHDVLGGDLAVGEVRLGAEQRGYHWWNVLPSGVEIDLTREQFRVGEVVTGRRIVPRPVGRPLRRAEEYGLLRGRVEARLGTLPASRVGGSSVAGLPAGEPAGEEPTRSAFDAGGHRLSYLDFGGPGRPLLALHGHFGEGRTFAATARDLAPEWRVIALDQRGHGRSDRPGDFSREGYIRDAAALLDHLELSGVVVLGHSLGGVNAYQLAARRPELVSALVVEDIGAEVDDDLSFCLSWPRRAPTRAALIEGLGESARHLGDAIREHSDGWGPVFDPKDMVVSQQCLNGDHWEDWLASDCPALLVHGTRSDVLSEGHAADIVARRPGTRLARLPTGHTVHESDPAGFSAVVREFLQSVGP
ncbi:alpha/beta hydrolase [Streptomyces sp. ISL-10]|uniref:alpha/beta fold hydrolase n=1 Tax=Streptomyces sp. ISL-10 TaxID=2819172 RepID=UPI001BE87730|nr:alpha/beta hydrolase [Streptomyces sp. ISL-10]MBT2367009.1 alpha/beta hydrolase [Streptomyces sp. ISL-10]